MKPYLAYKKQFSIISITLLAVFILFPIFFVYAQTAEDIRNKISQKDFDIAKLEEEIKAYQVELDCLGKQKASLSRSIQELDLTRKKLVADINVAQKKIDKTNLKIQNLSSDINNKQDIIINNIEFFKIDIKCTIALDLRGSFDTLSSV